MKDKFTKHLEWASSVVSRWPKWEQELFRKKQERKEEDEEESREDGRKN